MLIDTHCHLTSPELIRRIDDVLTAAHAAGIAHINQVATSAPDLRDSLELLRTQPAPGEQHSPANRPRLALIAGIHPHEAARCGTDDFAFLREVVSGAGFAADLAPRIVGIGETGLDFHYDFAPHDVQEDLFRAHLALAVEFHKPIVIHARESEARVCDILAEFPALAGRVVFHCFSGDPLIARRALDLGCLLSFTGAVTFRKAENIQAAARLVPADRMMLETDAPYLSPEPVRKIRPNEPALLAHTAHFVAQLRGDTFERLAANTTANATRFFGLTED